MEISEQRPKMGLNFAKKRTPGGAGHGHTHEQFVTVLGPLVGFHKDDKSKPDTGGVISGHAPSKTRSGETKDPGGKIKPHRSE